MLNYERSSLAQVLVPFDKAGESNKDAWNSVNTMWVITGDKHDDPIYLNMTLLKTMMSYYEQHTHTNSEIR